MDGLEAINELNDLTAKLSAGLKLMSRYGKELALAESEYRQALERATTALRNEGTPATLIDKIVGGRVAKDRYKRDVAEVMYKASMENINILKIQTRILDNQIGREWGHSDNG